MLLLLVFLFISIVCLWAGIVKLNLHQRVCLGDLLSPYQLPPDALTLNRLPVTVTPEYALYSSFALPEKLPPKLVVPIDDLRRLC